MTNQNYLKNLKDRKQAEVRKRQRELGLFGGCVCVVLSAFYYLFIVNKYDYIWKSVFIVGICLILAGALRPHQLLSKPEKIWTNGTQYLGRYMFGILLTIIYFTVLSPLGILYCFVKGKGLFLSWTNVKDVTYNTSWEYIDTTNRIDLWKNGKKKSMLVLFFDIGQLYLNRKQWFLIPMLMILVLLGLVLFFVEGTVVAPFIYTLF